MFIDARDLPDNSQIECDVCIVGSGPAGITLASELAGTGARVWLVESGGLTLQSDTQTSNVAEQLGLPVEIVDSQIRQFGGTSNVWGGFLGRAVRLKPLDRIDFEARDWVPNSGWPFKYRELVPFYERACKFLNRIPWGYFNEDQHYGQLLRVFRDDVLRTTIYQLPKPVRFGQRHRNWLVNSQDIRVLLRSRAIEIEEAESVSTVKSIHVVTSTGEIHRLSASYFVLACGGIENPRLLLVSTRKRPCGVGNEHDLVGRYYMQHPKGRHGFVYLSKNSSARLYAGRYRPNTYRLQAGVSVSERVQRRDRLLNHCVMLIPTLSFTESYVAEKFRELRSAWREGRRGTELFRGALDFSIDVSRIAAPSLKRVMKNSFPLRTTQFRVINHMEQFPDAESKVDLSDEKDNFGIRRVRMNWQIHPLEKSSLCSLHELLHDNLERHGMGKLQSDLDPKMPDWPVSTSSSHHMGTTRMHSDPRQGVTDGNCRVHSVQNLFIAGSSVFPTSGHANPTLTIVALSIRLADHLKALLKRSTR